MAKTRTIPLLPLRDIIVFPHMVVPLFVGRDKSIKSLEEAMSGDKEVLLAAQRLAKTNDPKPEDIFSIGTIGSIIQLLKLPDGTVKVLIEGKRRAKVIDYLETEDVFRVVCETVEPIMPDSAEISALISQVRETFESYVKLNKRIPPEMQMTVEKISDPGKLADTIVAHLNLKLNDKQTILETENPAERLEKLLSSCSLTGNSPVKRVRSRVKSNGEEPEGILSQRADASDSEGTR